MRNILFLIVLISSHVIGQNKMGNTWVFGINGQIASFLGDTSRPTTHQLFWSWNSPNYPYIFAGGHSNICDSATGKILFLCNGMQVFDTLGNIIENGDSLVPSKFYKHNAYPGTTLTQSSLIIPKGNSGLYYVFIPTVSDSLYNAIWAQQIGNKAAFDLLLYHVVDMNANGGAGKVIEKNKVLLQNTELHKTMMQACRHSNGVDWWLLKQGAYGTNEIIRFLVTKDSIYGPYVQQFSEPAYGTNDQRGQFAFNKEGTKFAAVQCKTNKLFMADFDRCTGELSNANLFNIPIDSTGYPVLDNVNFRDSVSTGVCFSSNNLFVYISKQTNIYQFEYNLSDSALAWYVVKHGADTTWNAFENYGLLAKGPDDRIYIGKGNGGFKQFSVINSPNNKGAACGFCRKCFRVDNALGGLNSPPNMPDYTLGPSNTTCWPLATPTIEKNNETLFVYPNPSHTTFYFKNKTGHRKYLYNTLGQLIRTTTSNEMDIRGLHPGVYYVQCDGETRKVIVE
jgi:hypothetical protein